MAEAHHASMRNMVEGMLTGVHGSQHGGQTFWAMAANSGNFSFRVDEETQARAKELIGEDGYFGVQKTMERIMDFAKALAGSNPDEKTIEKLRDGVQKGFHSVAKLFGGFDKLPEVTRNTYDAVMKAFDDWKVELGIVAPSGS